jgi:nitrogenase molybdenum-cofactor synthesis protein NifE
MGNLSLYLPPFTGDYSGVCSALFDLNCLIVINDASCCTRNYVNYDEPRWTLTKKTTLCSQLRTMDAILGDDEKVICQVVEAAQKLDPEFIAVLGSPVPAIIGMDMKGIAREIEARSNCPTFGFDTNGFSYYNKGISAAFLALLQRFTSPPEQVIAESVNILGLTPLDFSANNNSLLIRQLLEDNGLQVICSFLMQVGLDQVRRASAAEVNLVVSQSGWAAARYMQTQFGIPYVVATPLGRQHGQTVIQAIRQTARDQVNRIITGDPDSPQTEWNSPALLIIGDQVLANSLRVALRQAGCAQNITVASFFTIEKELALPGDIRLKSEKHLIELMRGGRYDSWVADPLIAGIPAASKLKSFLLPHPAVSSHLYWDEVPLFIGGDMENLLQRWVKVTLNNK